MTSSRCEQHAAPTLDLRRQLGLYRQCRRGGETVRRLVDCLIAAVAIREDVPVLHSDTDFEVLARHTPLTIERVS